MMTKSLALPANVSNAQLPALYENAKTALAECAQIDEAKAWADKAAAIASYARQADDESLRQLADKIRARAIRRVGELLAEIKPAQGGDRGGGRPSLTGNQSAGTVPLVSRTQAANAAGLSERQQKQALRVAAVPQLDFEAAIERPKPATVTELASMGTKPIPKPLYDLQGIDPEDFKAATAGHGGLRALAEVAMRIDPAAVVRGSKDHELAKLRAQAEAVIAWVSELIAELEKKR